MAKNRLFRGRARGAYWARCMARAFRPIYEQLERRVMADLFRAIEDPDHAPPRGTALEP